MRDLVGQLPHYSGTPLNLEKAVRSLSTSVAAPRGYVWPDLYVELSPNGHDEFIVESPIILVSAPGAMGKSVAAAAVAAEISAPLIDLSDLSVGSDTLTGLLASSLGWAQAPRLINNLNSGNAALVLDGLDEAQLRAGRDHTIAFLTNIVELVKDSSSATGQIIIFGRREAIETSYLVFNDNNISPAMVTIASLTYEQSNKLIDFSLSDKTINARPYDVHRTHSVPFGQLRDKLFGEIASALGASGSTVDEYWNEVGDFLGYPPVLLAFAERLAVDNPAAELSRTQTGGGQTPRNAQHGDLLKTIVEGILDRESQKVRNQLAQALSLEPNDPKVQVLYTREEQSLRVLKFTSGRVEIDLLPPVVLTGAERTAYEDLISAFVPDHPFLSESGRFANIVFADYVRAFVAVAPLAGVHGVSRIEILQACPAPGPFFAGLVHSIALDSPSLKPGEPKVALLDSEDLVDDLIKSFFAGSLADSLFMYTATSSINKLALYRAGNAERSPYSGLRTDISFEIHNATGVLELTSPLSQGVIISRFGLVLKSISDEVELGPNLVVVADSLQIKARRLIALGDPVDVDEPGPANEGGVYLLAQELDHDAILTVHSYPREALQVAPTEGQWHIWRPSHSIILPLHARHFTQTRRQRMRL